MTQTAGQALTAEIRKMMGIGTRTTRARVSHAEIVERIATSLQYPGYDSEARTGIFRAASAALLAWYKHVEGYRIDGGLRFRIMDMSPWRFAAFLGEMVDSGCTNVGEFEQWFSAQARQAA